MKKVLLFISLSLIFMSLLATIKANTITPIGFEFLLDIMKNSPRIDLSGFISGYESVIGGALSSIPIVGGIFEFITNLGVVLWTLAELLFNSIIMLVYICSRVLFLS